MFRGVASVGHVGLMAGRTDCGEVLKSVPTQG